MTDNILIIEGEPTLRRELTSALTQASFTVADVSDYSEALLRLAEFNPDIVIMDELLPSKDGIQACSQLRGTFGIPVILLGKDSSAKAWMRAVEAGADFYLTRPFNYEVLLARVKAILRRYRLSALKERYRQEASK